MRISNILHKNFLSNSTLFVVLFLCSGCPSVPVVYVYNNTLYDILVVTKSNNGLGEKRVCLRPFSTIVKPALVIQHGFEVVKAGEMLKYPAIAKPLFGPDSIGAKFASDKDFIVFVISKSNLIKVSKSKNGTMCSTIQQPDGFPLAPIRQQ